MYNTLKVYVLYWAKVGASNLANKSKTTESLLVEVTYKLRAIAI